MAEAVTIPSIAGTGSNDTRHCVDLTARRRPPARPACWSSAPYYNRPPQAGIEAHFRAVAAATDLPVMVYDVPGRTGRRIAGDVLRRLFTRGPQRRRLQGRHRRPGGRRPR